jgi:ABC-type uncharacterized transport system permease subunit
LEITRLFFRSGIRGAMMFLFAGAGLLAHTLFLIDQVVRFANDPAAVGLPLSSPRDWCLLAAWLLVVIYLHLTYYRPHTLFGLFLLPLVLGLIAVGRCVASPQPFPREPSSQAWAIVHGGSLLLATVAMLTAFAAGLMYLIQARRLKHKAPLGRGHRLPSLEWLRKANSHAILATMVLLAIGIFSGSVLNLLGAERRGGLLPWYDPVVLSTAALFAWLLVSSGISLVWRPAREGRKVAYLTIVSFLFLLIALAMVLSVNTRHGAAPPAASHAEAAA